MSETSGYFIEESSLEDVPKAIFRADRNNLMRRPPYYHLYIILVTLNVMPGIDFENHSCWDFKTLVVEGGMWIECTGTNLPKAGEEPYYMVEIKDYKKGFDGNRWDCPSGTDVRDSEIAHIANSSLLTNSYKSIIPNIYQEPGINGKFSTAKISAYSFLMEPKLHFVLPS